MNTIRLLSLVFCSFFVAPLASVHGQPSLRKISPIDVGFVESLRMSPDGRYIVMLSLPGEKGSDCIVFDRRTHKTKLVPGGGRLEPLVLSPMGHSLWIWGLELDEPLPGLRLKPSNHPFIALYNLRRKRFVRAFTIEDDTAVPSESVLSRNGRTLIYAAQDGWIYGLSTRTGKVAWKHRAQDKGDEPVSVTLNADGTKFLRTPDEENAIQKTEIVSTRSGRILCTLRIMGAQPNQMESAYSKGLFAPRGRQVAVFQSSTQQWAFFDSSTGELQWKMGGSSRTSEGDLKWQWSPNGRFVGVSSSKGFELRNARTGRVLRVCAGLKDASVTFSPSGDRVYTLRDNDTGFGAETAVWQWRLFPTRRQRLADERFMRHLRARENRFAVLPNHINESLIMACRNGDADRVALLLKRGANIHIKDGRGETPLECAVDSGDTRERTAMAFETVRLLVSRGADVNARGGSILAGAAANNGALTKFLLDHGARVNGDASGYGTPTALHAAVGSGQLQIVCLLILRGANVNTKGRDGKTPLMSLANSNFTGTDMNANTIARLLLLHGAHINDRDKQGKTALFFASNLSPSLARALQKWGAKQ